LGKAVQFAALTVLAIVLVPSEFGRFAVAQIVVTGLASIVSSSFAIAANRTAAARSSDGEPGAMIVMAGSVYLHRRAIGLTLLLLVVVAPTLYGLLSGDGFQWWTTAWALLAVAMVISDVAVGALAGAARLRTSALFDTGRVVVGGIGALALGMGFGYIGAAYGLILGDVILASVIAAGLAGVRSELKADIAPLTSSRTIRAGLVANGTAQIAMWTLTAAIQVGHGLNGVGTYSVANRFAALVLVAPGLISKNSLGVLAREHERRGLVDDQRVGAVSRYVAICGALVLVASIAVLLVVAAAFGGLALRYENFHAVLAILLLATVARAMATALGVVCVAWGMLGIWQISDLCAAVTTIIWIAVASIGASDLGTLLLGLVLGAVVALAIRAGALIVTGRRRRAHQ